MKLISGFLLGLAVCYAADSLEFRRLEALHEETRQQRKLAISQAERCVRLANKSDAVLQEQVALRNQSANVTVSERYVSPPAWVLGVGGDPM